MEIGTSVQGRDRSAMKVDRKARKRYKNMPGTEEFYRKLEANTP